MKSKTVLALVLTAGLVRSAPASDAVTIGASLNARQPQLAVDSGGGIHLAFGSDGTVFYTSSGDRGASFSKPVAVASVKALALGMRRGPRIAVSNGDLVITAIGGSLGGGRDGDLFAWRSADHGKSWQGPVQVNDTTASAREGLHALAAAPNGDFFCVWLDLRNQRTQLFGSRSTDGGATWSKNTLIYESPEGSICECCHPSVVYDRNSALHVLWRNSLDGNRDMYWTKSTDGGHTFAKAVRFGKQSWQLDACPMDGGAIAIAPGGQPAAVWRRDQAVFLTADQPTSERRIGAGLQPWLAANGQGLYAVWLGARPGDLYFLPPGDNSPTKLASHARDPVIVAAAEATGPLIVAWETDESGRGAIKVQTISRGK